MKLTVAVLAVVIASAASAAGWRGLRVDGSSEAGFAESLALFEKKLSPSRRYAFTLALQEIWIQGTKKASAEQRTYATSEYLRQLDGLGYDEVVRIPDATGAAEERYRTEYYAGYRLENGTPRPGGHNPQPFRSNDSAPRYGPAGAQNAVPGPNPWQLR